MKSDAQAQLNGAQQDALAATFSSSYAGVVAFIAVATEGSFARFGSACVTASAA